MKQLAICSTLSAALVAIPGHVRNVLLRTDWEQPARLHLTSALALDYKPERQVIPAGRHHLSASSGPISGNNIRNGASGNSGA